jgi:guanylate kinase
MWNKNILFVISGPSGSGKTTLLKNLLKDKDTRHKLIRSVSFTTRPKRLGEKEGKDYFFITERAFRKKLKTKKILEWTRFLNYYYGTLKEHFNKLIKKDQHLLLCLDEKGAFKIKQRFCRNTVTIFILPPKIESLKTRMVSPERKVAKEDLLKRLALARKQIRLCKDYDYRIINDNFNMALKRLKKVIVKEMDLREAVKS